MATAWQPPPLPPLAEAAAAAAAPPTGGGDDGDPMWPTTSYIDPRGNRHPYGPAPKKKTAPVPTKSPDPASKKRKIVEIEPAQALQDPTVPAADDTAVAAVNPTSVSSSPGPEGLPGRDSSAATGPKGRELGRQLLGVARRKASAEEAPRQRRRASTSSRPQSPRNGSGASALGHGMALDDSPEDVAAMEYLKWELHGEAGVSEV